MLGHHSIARMLLAKGAKDSAKCKPISAPTAVAQLWEQGLYE